MQPIKIAFLALLAACVTSFAHAAVSADALSDSNADNSSTYNNTHNNTRNNTRNNKAFSAQDAASYFNQFLATSYTQNTGNSLANYSLLAVKQPALPAKPQQNLPVTSRKNSYNSPSYSKSPWKIRGDLGSVKDNLFAKNITVQHNVPAQNTGLVMLSSITWSEKQMPGNSTESAVNRYAIEAGPGYQMFDDHVLVYGTVGKANSGFGESDAKAKRSDISDGYNAYKVTVGMQIQW